MNDRATFIGRDTLRIVRYLPGPLERVWSYLTEPALLAKWFSAGEVADHVGGDVCFEIGASGSITAYERLRLIEFTWNEEESSHGPVVDALVRWELAEEGDRVRLTLTHARLPANELAPHAAGWHTFLERLEDWMRGREPVPVRERFQQLRNIYEATGPNSGENPECL